MELETSVHKRFDHRREPLFDYLVDCATATEIFGRRGPIAGIVGMKMVGDAPVAKGAHRTVTMDDGVVLDEEIVEFERPNVHAYAWAGGLKAPFSWVVRGATGRWVFSDDGDGTLVRWTYRFELTSPLAYPVAAIAARFFRAWMGQALDRGAEKYAET